MTVPFSPDPFPFPWHIELLGYEWVRGYDSEWRLTACTGGERKLWVYSPLKDDALFLRFAGLKINRTAIKKFANQYGDLFNTWNLAELVRRPTGQYRISQLLGTSFGIWKQEIEAIRDLVRVWRAVTRGRRRDLEKVIRRESDNSVGYELGTSLTWVATPNLNQSLLARFRPKDVFKPAMYLLQKEINRRIADETSRSHVAILPELVWCPGPRVDRIARPDHHQRIIFRPKNLLAAMWLQFARAVTADYPIRMCEGCGEYFQIGKGARRTDAQTCSSRCRQRVSRMRRSER